jgi:hypothetical protein
MQRETHPTNKREQILKKRKNDFFFQQPTHLKSNHVHMPSLFFFLPSVQIQNLESAEQNGGRSVKRKQTKTNEKKTRSKLFHFHFFLQEQKTRDSTAATVTPTPVPIAYPADPASTAGLTSLFQERAEAAAAAVPGPPMAALAPMTSAGRGRGLMKKNFSPLPSSSVTAS